MPINLFLFILTSVSVFSCNGQDSGSSSVIGKNVSRITSNPLVIFQDSQYNLWFGGGKEGVYKLKKAVHRDGADELILYNRQDGLCSTSVVGIQEDKYGNIYFDTSEGIYRFDGTQFSELKITKASDNWVLNPDDLWFRLGWEGNGPLRYDGKDLYALEFPMTSEAQLFYERFPDASWSPFGLYTMFKDSKGRMWFGTATSGICLYDGQSFKWLYEDHLTTTPEGGDFGIRSIIEDKEGKFWFCNPTYRYNILNGFHKEKGSPYINYQSEGGASIANGDGSVITPYFMSMIKDRNEAIWMATYDQGVYKLDGRDLIRYPIRGKENNILAFSIYEDLTGKIWLTTHNGGPMIFNGNEFIPFHLSD